MLWERKSRLPSRLLSKRGIMLSHSKTTRGTCTKRSKPRLRWRRRMALETCNGSRIVASRKATGGGAFREYWTIRDAEILEHLDPENKWDGLRGIGIVRAERRIGQEMSRETRYFLLSFSAVNTFAYAVRSHWGIENSLRLRVGCRFSRR